MHSKYEDIFSQLDNDLDEITERLESLNHPEIQKYNELCQKKLQTLKASLERYCNQHIILSFNGSRYDLALIKLLQA